MKRIFALLVVLTAPAEAFAQGTQEKAGDIYRITVAHVSESKGDGSSSSSRGRHEYIERIVAIRPDGVERVYDLPLDPADDKRLINWHFPVHVFEANDGSIQLLNREEMEGRRDAWLKAAEIPREACGSWYFTWDAFQVECDPESILANLKSIDVQPPNLSDGEFFQHPAALEPGHLSLYSSDGEGKTYRVQMTVDPDFVRRAEARNDVIVGEIMKKPVSFGDAYVERKNEQITGVIKVVLEARPDDRVWRRTTTTEIEKVEADGQIERQVSTEEIERRVQLNNTP